MAISNFRFCSVSGYVPVKILFVSGFQFSFLEPVQSPGSDATVLQKNPSGPTNTLVLQHFCVFDPFPTMTVWFWDTSFHTEYTLYTSPFCSKVFTHWLLMHRFPFGASVSIWTFCNSCISCPLCEKMHLKIIQSLLERVQLHKNAAKPNYLWDLRDFSEEQQAV